MNVEPRKTYRTANTQHFTQKRFAGAPKYKLILSVELAV
jgi:hypothetical protein